MKVSISNIAWDVSEDEDVAALLGKYQVGAIDIAPGKYFKNPSEAKKDDILHVKKWWSDQNISIIGMQALLFGTSGLNMFGSNDSQEKMLNHLEHVCSIASTLGATRLTFGSPKNRDRSGLSDDLTQDIAFTFFKRLGNIAANHGVIICLETNPAFYECNFMTKTPETAQMVKAINLPSIQMQLDLGAITMNQENPEEMIQKYANLVGHVHISEPNLKVLNETTTQHNRIGKIMSSALPNHFATIEMRATDDEPHLQSIEKALKITTNYYR